MTTNHFPHPILVPEVAFWGFWGLVCIEKWSQNFDWGTLSAIFDTPKMAKTPHFCHFHFKNCTLDAQIKILRPLFNTNQPPKPPKSHLRNQNWTSKSDFWSFFQLCIFFSRFPISTSRFFQTRFCKGRRPLIKKCKKIYRSQN